MQVTDGEDATQIRYESEVKQTKPDILAGFRWKKENKRRKRKREKSAKEE